MTTSLADRIRKNALYLCMALAALLLPLNAAWASSAVRAETSDSATAVRASGKAAEKVTGTQVSVREAVSFPKMGHPGLSGSYVGVVDNVLVIAGGSDFPTLKPWEGGVKTYYGDILLITYSKGKYECRLAEGTLPEARGGGCAVSDGKTLYCFGGLGQDGQLARAVLGISLDSGHGARADSVAVLPEGFIPASAALCKGEIYIGGSYAESDSGEGRVAQGEESSAAQGEESSAAREGGRVAQGEENSVVRDAGSSAAIDGGGANPAGQTGGRNALWRFSPGSRQWKELSGCPDRTVSEGSVAVSQFDGREDAVFFIGGRGVDSQGLYLSAAVWEYLPSHEIWTRKADIAPGGEAGTLMYCSAVPYGSSHIIVFGGDDGAQFRRRYEIESRIALLSETLESRNDSAGPTAKASDSQRNAGTTNETGNADQSADPTAEISDSRLTAGTETINARGMAATLDSLRAELVRANVEHPGFGGRILAYHTITDTWIALGESALPIPAVTTASFLSDRIIIPGGELHPGVRSGSVLEATVTDRVSFGWINYAVIIAYLLGMMGLGFHFYRKSRDTSHFFRGGGRIPWWAAGISIFATALSAITFLSIPAKAYMSDWGMFVFNMAIVLIVPIVIRFYLPFFRKLNVASIYQYLEDRFNAPVRYMASAFFCLFMLVRVAIVLFLPSLALNAVTGINVWLCILLMGGVTLIYCTLGGIEAVIWGDVVQGAILVGGAVLTLVFLIAGTDGGFSGAFTTAVADHKFNILDFRFDWTRPVFWVALIAGIANQLLTYSSDQSVVQRYMTVKDTRSTRKSIWLNGLLSIPITILFFSIGTGLYVYFKSHPDLLNIGMRNTDSIFPHFMMCGLPVGIAGLLIAAVFAAAMSTLSANINSTATVMTEDFFMRLSRDTSERRKMRFARWAGIGVGLFGIVTALVLAISSIASLWDQFNFFLGLLTGGIGGLFMMGVFTRRIGPRAALTGFAGSVAVMLLCYFTTDLAVILYGFIGLVSSFLLGWLSSFLYGYGK